MKGGAILVADDDPEVLSYLETALMCHDYPVLAAQDGAEALSLLEEHRDWIAAAVLDVMMPCKDGIATLLEIRRRYPDLPVVMISGTSDPDRIVEAMNAGVQEYLTKPVVHERLLEAVRRSLSRRPIPRVALDSSAMPAGAAEVSYIQINPRMRAISQALRKTAGWNVPVVLRGESGVGKEVLARELHSLSPRANKEFVKINCVALPSELLESELFGYERGAFTGAFKAKPGKFELADGGTILLDEIGDMDLKLQAKLLQVLQDGEFHRLGGKDPVHVDVRVLVATHRDLEKSIAEGSFREDLYYRLNVVSIEVPPLRERRDEILPLAQHFLSKHGQRDSKPPELSEDLKRAFLAHHWPGNVRELENVVRRYLVFEDAQMLAFELLGGSAARAAAAGGSEGIDRRIYSSGIGRPGTQIERAPDESAYPSEDGVTRRDPALYPPSACPDPRPSPPAREHASPDFPDWVEASSLPARRDWEPVQALPDEWSVRLARLEGMLGRLVANRNVAANGETAAAAQANQNSAAAAPPQNGQLSTLDELDEQRNQIETRTILAALDQTEWNRKKAARLLKTDYKALLYRMKKLGIGDREQQT